MRQAQQGDASAYASLLVALVGVARQFVRRRAGAAVPWVDDVVQDALLALHAARHTYDPARPFAPWFYAIVSNRMVDVVRRERRVSARELHVDALPERAAADARGRDELDVDAIHAALASLPARQREVIEGLKYRDQSVREVAGRMGMTESAVKVTAHRGYRALRRLLGGASRED